MDKSFWVRVSIFAIVTLLALFDIVLRITILILMSRVETSYHKREIINTADATAASSLLFEYSCTRKYEIQGGDTYLSTCINNTDIIDLREWKNATPTLAGVTLSLSSYESMCAHSVRQYFT